MVLLTSSTVSVILSSSVVCMFTFFLFLSGYVLQQQSVRNIQVALQPRSPPPPLSPQIQESKRGLPGIDLVKRGQNDDNDNRNIGNYAYLQLISNPDPSDICSAILFFKTLAMNNTAIPDRLLMYPKQWDKIPDPSSEENEEEEDSNMQKQNESRDREKNKNLKEKKKKNTSKKNKLNYTKQQSKALQHLREASIKYNIWLLPIDMSLSSPSTRTNPITYGRITDTKLLAIGQIQFMQYDSVLYLQTPGMIQNVNKLDQLLLNKPLPGKHDKNRLESFNNEAWIPLPLRPHLEDFLPPVYLVTVNNVLSKSRVEARTHVPNPFLRGFADLVVEPGKLVASGYGSGSLNSRIGAGDCDSSQGQIDQVSCSQDLKMQLQQQQQPGYVYFKHDRYGRVNWKDNPIFGQWRAQQYEVCPGLDLDSSFSE